MGTPSSAGRHRAHVARRSQIAAAFAAAAGGGGGGGATTATAIIGGVKRHAAGTAFAVDAAAFLAAVLVGLELLLLLAVVA